MRTSNLFAGIDIGANATRMSISQIEDGSNYKVLDTLIQPLRLGKEVFVTNKLSIETTNNIIEALSGFKQTMQDYGITNHRVVATSALREAVNRLFILQRIKETVGFDIEIIDSTEEIFLTFLSLKNDPFYEKLLQKGTTLFIEMGRGDLKLGVVHDGILIFCRPLKIGALRLTELFSSLKTSASRLLKVLNTYINYEISFINNALPNYSIDNFITTGSIISDIILLLNIKPTDTGLIKIETQKLTKQIRELTTTPINDLLPIHNMSFEEMELILTSLIVYKNILKLHQCPSTYLDDVSLLPGIVSNYIARRKRKTFLTLKENTIESVMNIGTKYQFDRQHALNTRMFADKIFKDTRKLHRLKEKDKLILDVAALLHDVGRYINESDHQYHSEYIIRSEDIVGISEKEKYMAGLLTRSHRKEFMDFDPDRLDYEISPAQIAMLAKFSVILRIANALDLGHDGAVNNISINLKKRSIDLIIFSNEDLSLQKWALNHEMPLWEEVFLMPMNLVVRTR